MAGMKWSRARAIAALYKAGETMQDIADRYGISKQRVSVIIRDQTGLDARSKGYRRVRQEEHEECQPQS